MIETQTGTRHGASAETLARREGVIRSRGSAWTRHGASLPVNQTITAQCIPEGDVVNPLFELHLGDGGNLKKCGCGKRTFDVKSR